jgi:hypothetical protein
LAACTATGGRDAITDASECATVTRESGEYTWLTRPIRRPRPRRPGSPVSSSRAASLAGTLAASSALTPLPPIQPSLISAL